jgi:DNA polymerase III subunit delta
MTSIYASCGGDQSRSRYIALVAAGTEVLAQIRQGKLQPVYYLCGEERFLVDRALAAIRTVVFGSESAQAAAAFLAYDMLVAGEVGPVEISHAARTLPMLCKRRLVVVREASALDAEELQALLPYIRDPNPQTCLVLVGEKPDMRTKAISELDKLGVLVRFDRLRDREIVTWLRGEAKLLDVAADDDALAVLADSLGNDLGTLHEALERLALYVGPAGRVRVADVEDCVPRVRARSVFELGNAVGRGDLREALLVLARLRDGREEPLGVLAMLARHMRQLWIVRDLKTRAPGATTETVLAQRLRIPPFFVRPMIEQARRFPESSLRAALEILLDCDRKIKSSRVDGWRVLERALLSICGDRPDRSSVRSGGGAAAKPPVGLRRA